MADDGKIVPIGIHAIPDAANPDVVEKLALLLEEAKLGKITGFTIVTQGDQRLSVITSLSEDLATLLGHLDIMHADITHKAVAVFQPGPRRG